MSKCVFQGRGGVALLEPGLEKYPSEQGFGRDSSLLVLAEAVGVFTLGKLLAAAIDAKGVVQIQGARIGGNLERGVACTGFCNHLRKGNLAGGGTEDVLAADNVRDLLREVIDADGELVGPETVAVTDREVATLLLRVFVEVSETLVMPVYYFV